MTHPSNTRQPSTKTSQQPSSRPNPRVWTGSHRNFAVSVSCTTPVRCTGRRRPEMAGAEGLIFNEDKACIVHLEDGFDFLGFNVRRYRRGYGLGKLLIAPSQDAVRRIRKRLADEMRSLRGSNAMAVVVRLNPIIRGWAAYYRGVVSSEQFSALDHLSAIVASGNDRCSVSVWPSGYRNRELVTGPDALTYSRTPVSQTSATAAANRIRTSSVSGGVSPSPSGCAGGIVANSAAIASAGRSSAGVRTAFRFSSMRMLGSQGATTVWWSNPDTSAETVGGSVQQVARS